MTLIAVLAGLAILTLWGAVAPRGQWRVLSGLSRSRPYAYEPAPAVVGIHRFVAIVASVALISTGASYYLQRHTLLPVSAQQPKTVLEQMWSDADPAVVNRVIEPYDSTPFGLHAQPILRYQPVDGADHLPAYMFALPVWTPNTMRDGDGFIGSSPGEGQTALDGADVVVQVRADPACIPRAVVVNQGDKSVAIGVYYGRPSPAKGAPRVAISRCSGDVPATNGSTVLLPVPLAAPIGKRAVITLTGKPIELSRDITSG